MEYSRSRMWRQVIVAIATGVLLTTASVVSGQDKGEDKLPRGITKKTKRLWDQHVMNRPNPRILDDFEVIEGMALLHSAGDITRRTAAFASVALEVGSPAICDFALDRKKIITYAVELTDTAVSETEQQKLNELGKRAREAYGRRPSVRDYGTYMLGDALSLQKTIGDAETIEECVDRLGKVHGWVPALEKSRDCGFLAYKESIDKGVPILLLRDGEWFVCFAYIRARDKEYIAVANPQKVPLVKGESRELSGSPEALEAARTDEDVRQILQGINKTLGDVPRDYRAGPNQQLLRGMRVEEFKKGRYTAYFIYNWRASAAGWREEIIEIVGEPKDETDEEEEWWSVADPECGGR